MLRSSIAQRPLFDKPHMQHVYSAMILNCRTHFVTVICSTYAAITLTAINNYRQLVQQNFATCMRLTTATDMYLFDIISVEQHSSLHWIVEPEQQPTDSLLMTMTTVGSRMVVVCDSV
jgi:hypothetical protein